MKVIRVCPYCYNEDDVYEADLFKHIVVCSSCKNEYKLGYAAKIKGKKPYDNNRNRQYHKSYYKN